MTEMAPRLIKGSQADYIPAKWDGKDTSGVKVQGATVLVLMDECSPYSSGAGGATLLKEAGITPSAPAGTIMGTALPLDIIEKMNFASESGVIVRVSPGAFRLYEDLTPWTDERPKPGDRCYVDRYAGKQVTGRDGKTYRLLDYRSIGATYLAEGEDA